MVNPQQYLNNNYSNKKNTKQIKFDSNNLELTTAGELVISDYPNLKKIMTWGSDIKYITKVTISKCPQLKQVDINDFVDNKKLTISSCPNLEKIWCWNNQLSELVGLKELSKLTELQCWNNQLTDLDISNCQQLKILNCRTNKLASLDVSKLEKLEDLKCLENQLTNLDINNCLNLKILHCRNNKLTNLNFSALNSKKLQDLSIRNNNFSQTDLSTFSPFVNLEYLYIGTDEEYEEQIKQNIYNRFTGNLESLKSLTKLRELHISNTDINKGVESLPTSLKKIFYSTEVRPDSKVKEIIHQLDFKSGKKQKDWANSGFASGEIKHWLEAGLEIDECIFASYLKKNNYEPSKINAEELENLKREYHQAQTWLDWNYPTEKRSGIVNLDISNKSLEGALNLNEFPNLKRLNCHVNQLTSLDLTNCEKLEYLSCRNNKLKKLILSKNNKLTELFCYKNQLADLTLPDKLDNLQKLYCWGNELTSINLSALNSEKLTGLDVSDNNLPESDLSIFSTFINLEELYLGNTSGEKINQNIYNRFHGSLEPLKNLTKLRELNISDINGSLEHLSDSVKEIYCSDQERPESKVRELTEQLKASPFFDLNKNKYIRNWKEIHLDFTEELQGEWKNLNFSHEEVKEWIEAGLNPHDCKFADFLRNNKYQPNSLSNYNLANLREEKEWKEVLGESYKPKSDWAFCAWLRDEKNLTSQEVKQQNNLENLREEYNKLWTDIHKDFAEKNVLSGKTQQQLWEEAGVSYQEAQQWIPAGFELSDYNEVKQWKDYNFTPQEVKSWLEVGLISKKANRAAYLKENGYTPRQFADKFKFKNQRSTREWIDYFYPLEERKETKKLDISHENLTGTLNLSDFINLEELQMSSNQISDISFLQQLPNPEKLRVLDLSSNNIVGDLTPFSRFTNLEELILGEHFGEKGDNIKKKKLNRFSDSLEPLKNLTKLKKLDISNTDLDKGLEYLPESIEEFYSSSDLREDSKVKIISNYFEGERDQKDKQEESNFIQKKLRSWKKHRKHWEEKGFSEQEFEKWIKMGLKIDEWGYANYLRQKGHNSSGANTKRLRKEYEKHIGKENADKLSEEIFKQLEEFDHNKLTSEQKLLVRRLIPNKELRKRYKKGGLCLECKQPNTWAYKKSAIEKDWPYAKEGVWCQPCGSKHFQENKKNSNWTSGDSEVDNFILKTQKEADNSQEVLEWIPYEQFEIEKDEQGNSKVLGKGGFGEVYKAKWKDGPIKEWNIENSKWEREGEKEIVLKVLSDSKNITANFLNEIANHKICSSKFILPLYGISQNTDGSYVMVMDYMDKGDLRKILTNEDSDLYGLERIGAKFARIVFIIGGLDAIHEQGLVHRDLHPGNILNYDDFMCFITDFGLCKPVDEIGKEGEIYGVLPYVAPEVLQGQPYTQKSDIYSFGILAAQMLTDLPPYVTYDKETDSYKELPYDNNLSLSLKICRGLRPNIDEAEVPQMAKDLIKRCWNADPTKRPTARELKKELIDPILSIVSSISSEEGLKEIEIIKLVVTKLPKLLDLPGLWKKWEFDEPEIPQCQSHPGASRHSKLINTGEISKITHAIKGLNLDPSKISEQYILEQLTALLKDKLQSKSLFSEDKRKVRKEQLESLFKNIPETLEEFIAELEKIKPRLSKKIPAEKIREFLSIRSEFTKSQTSQPQSYLDSRQVDLTLDNSQTQENPQEECSTQAHIQIPPKGNN